MLFATSALADLGPRERFDVVVPNIAGSTWLASDGPLGQVTYRFDRSGVLEYTYANGAVFRNGTWQVRGDVLYFEANQKYREFRAHVRGNRIEGPSWNKAGLRWTTTLTPVRK